MGEAIRLVAPCAGIVMVHQVGDLGTETRRLARGGLFGTTKERLASVPP